MQEKYLRNHACENILLEIPCFKFVNFQKYYFSIASLSQENSELITWQGMLQRKSRNISVVVVMDFWWLIQLPDEVQTFGTQKKGLTAPYLEFANYSCTSIAIYDFSFGVILKSRLLSQTAAEHVFKVEDK